MRALVVVAVPALVLSILLMLMLMLSGCLEDGPVCCTQAADCDLAATCFENVCAVRCTDDGQCLEGEECVRVDDGAGACRRTARNAELDRCGP